MYHFYNLRDLIFKDVRACLSESQIDLFYDERIGDGIAVAFKFSSNIDPKEPKDYICILQQGFEKVFLDDFISSFFYLFVDCEMKKAALCEEFLIISVSGQWKEVIKTAMVVLYVISRSNKKMVSAKILYRIPEGYMINHFLKGGLDKSKRYVIEELDNLPLRLGLDYCYANNAYSCLRTDQCYYCTIIDFIGTEFRKRRSSDNGYYHILQKEKRACSCWVCRKDNDPHYVLL